MTETQPKRGHRVGGRFQGQTAIVTGAGSGIGRATAIRPVGEGATVIATDVVEDRLAALADETGTDRVRILPGDISLEETARALVAAAAGRIDVLANVAGIADRFLPVGAAAICWLASDDSVNVNGIVLPSDGGWAAK